MTDSTTQSAKKLPWENLKVSLNEFCILTRQRSNLRTFQTVCSYKTWYCRSGLHERRNFFSARGDALSPGEKSVPSTHKNVPPFLRAQKITPLGIEPTTCVYNFNPMVTFHGGAGRLSRGIGHIPYTTFHIPLLYTILHNPDPIYHIAYPISHIPYTISYIPYTHTTTIDTSYLISNIFYTPYRISHILIFHNPYRTRHIP